MSRYLVFSTGNQGKLDWLRNELHNYPDLHDITIQGDATETIEIQSSSLADISAYKAQQAFDRLQKPVISLDAGFYITAWNGFPGPFGKYMIEDLSITQWTKLIAGLDDKRCEFKHCLTFIDRQGMMAQFHDTTDDIFMLTEHAWPHDHPKQWSKLWRLMLPSGLGFDKPMAGLSDAELQDYTTKRMHRDADNTCFTKLAKHFLANPHCLG